MTGSVDLMLEVTFSHFLIVKKENPVGTNIDESEMYGVRICFCYDAHNISFVYISFSGHLLLFLYVLQ